MKATTSRTLPSIMLSIVFIGLASLQIHQVTSFSTTKSLIGRRSSIVPSSLSTGRRLKSTTLHMAKGKKKRRKRKNAPPQQPSNTIIPEDDMEAIKELSQSESQTNIDELKAIANFQATAGGSSSTTTSSINNIGLDGAVAGGGEGKSLVEVPDIRDALKNKELKRIEEEEAQKLQRPKISRKDTKAFLELLEAEPFADADDSYFEDEEYGTVSALLAEGAKPFLGIPPGPLQVGHFIGSLGIILCAFIDYPGFPLTNLPTPLRDALQGGLGVIYLINTLLAVLAVFKASERGQSPALWAVKTFSVGGLALDQLTQLPTLKQVEEMQNRKGARAIKNRKK